MLLLPVAAAIIGLVIAAAVVELVGSFICMRSC